MAVAIPIGGGTGLAIWWDDIVFLLVALVRFINTWGAAGHRSTLQSGISDFGIANILEDPYAEF